MSRQYHKDKGNAQHQSLQDALHGFVHLCSLTGTAQAHPCRKFQAFQPLGPLVFELPQGNAIHIGRYPHFLLPVIATEAAGTGLVFPISHRRKRHQLASAFRAGTSRSHLNEIQLAGIFPGTFDQPQPHIHLLISITELACFLALQQSPHCASDGFVAYTQVMGPGFLGKN